MAGKRRLQRVFPDAEGPEAAASPGLAVGATMDAAEVEFLAEKELVTIIPNFSLDKIYLIGVRPAGPPARPGRFPLPGGGRGGGSRAHRCRAAFGTPRR